MGAVQRWPTLSRHKKPTTNRGDFPTAFAQSGCVKRSPSNKRMRAFWLGTTYRPDPSQAVAKNQKRAATALGWAAPNKRFVAELGNRAPSQSSFRRQRPEVTVHLGIVGAVLPRYLKRFRVYFANEAGQREEKRVLPPRRPRGSPAGGPCRPEGSAGQGTLSLRSSSASEGLMYLPNAPSAGRGANGFKVMS